MQKAISAGLIAFTILPAVALGQDSVSFSTAVDLNYKKLNLTVISNTPFGSVTSEFKPQLWTLGISPSVAYQGFFLALAAERTVSEGTTSGPSSTSGWFDRRDSRDENSVTAGYNVWRWVSLFAGYMNNNTRTTTVTYSGSTAFIGDSKYTEKGPYYGLALSHRFAGGSSLGASYALARADGKLSSRSMSSTGATTISDREGDVKGTSFGLSWSAPLTGSLFYRIGYKGTRYDFDTTFTFASTTQQQSTRRDYDAFFIGIANYF